MRRPTGRVVRYSPTALLLALLCCLAGWAPGPLSSAETWPASGAELSAADGDEWTIRTDIVAEDADSDGYDDDEDCDDGNPAVYPGAPEICDGFNNDCDDPDWPHLIAWGAKVISFTAADVQSVFAADVDGDGDVDALSASDADDKIAWYENVAGDGSAWSEHVISITTNRAMSVFAADVDGDGDTDALSASWLSGIAWYENMAGDGSAWSEHVITTSALYALSVVAADVDGDGNVDVLSASDLRNEIAWHENLLGDGSSWTSHSITTSANGAKSVFAADVDGDGDLDALSASSGDDKIAWYENEWGDGSSWRARVISHLADFASAVFAADVDGDGDVDALSASKADDKIAWYENRQGDGTGWVSHVISVSVDACITVFAADVDADGDPDVLTASAGGEVLWFENAAGDGSEWASHIVAGSVESGRAVVAEDVDGDGDWDVLSAGNYFEVAWYERGGLETDDDDDGLRECDGDCDDAQLGCTNDCGDADSDGVAMCAGDCDDEDPVVHPNQDESGETLCWDGKDNDCDGLADDGDPGCICTGTNEDGDRYCLPEDCDDMDPAVYPGAPQICGDGVNNDCDLEDWPYLWVWEAGEIPTSADHGYSVFPADLDGDGDLDALVSVSYTEGLESDPYIEWYENLTGDGSAWTGHTICATRGNPYPADVDGDGDLDVLVESSEDGTIAWHENTTGDGSAWTEHTIAASIDSPASPIAADFDGDGDLDALSGAWGDAPRISWHENIAGDGSAWTEHIIDATSAEGRPADVDGDGDVDVLDASSGQLVWFENVVGDGSDWTEHSIYVSTNLIMDFRAADVDGDGDLDALSSEALPYYPPYDLPDSLVLWHENSAGDGSIWTEHEVRVSGGLASVFAGDVDGDGDVDIVITADAWAGGTWILWEENTAGDGSAWTWHFVVSVWLDYVSILPAVGADLDDDGDLDVMHASSVPPVVRWHELMSVEDDGDGICEQDDCDDGDSDGICEQDDCDDGDGLTWAVPGEVLDLVFSADRETLVWTSPTEPGCVGEPLYDTLRTTAAADFVNAATCVEWGDDSDTQAVDSELPPAGTVYHYLVCAATACGTGPAGTDSDGVERALRVCP